MNLPPLSCFVLMQSMCKLSIFEIFSNNGGKSKNVVEFQISFYFLTKSLLYNYVYLFPKKIGNRWSCFQEDVEPPVAEPLVLRNQTSAAVSSYSFQRVAASDSASNPTTAASTMSDWFVRDFGKLVIDDTKTFCANPKVTKGWYQNGTGYDTNVTLLHFLKFNQVYF